MAAPHVAGCAALLKSAFPDATGDEIVEALKNSAIGQEHCGRDARFGHGHVDCKRAADYISNKKQNINNIATCQDIKISITTDNWGNETSWNIFKVFGNASDVESDIVLVPIASGGPYEYGLETTVAANVGVPDDGCYAMAIYDAFGDG